jgi:release factor glutamine methyltransferase
LRSAPSLRDELRRGTAALERAGCDTPRLDAELLLASVLGVGRAELVLSADSELAPEAVGGFERLLERRAAREPVAYILGDKPFRRISLAVDPRVLIPRPETELLVEVGLGLPAGARVADVGTGSGAVALALKDERPDLSVVGTDVSEDALVVARENSRRLGLAVEWVHGDLLADRVAVDAVLANLPYVAEGDELPPEITLYEPASALFAGPDGLDVIRRLVGLVGPRGSPSLLALEIGASQGAVVSELVAAAGFGRVETLRDLAGLDRVVVGRR